MIISLHNKFRKIGKKDKKKMKFNKKSYFLKKKFSIKKLIVKIVNVKKFRFYLIANSHSK